MTATDSPSHPKVQAMKDGDFGLWLPKEVDPIFEALDEYHRNYYAKELWPSLRCEDVEENPLYYYDLPKIGIRLYKVFADHPKTWFVEEMVPGELLTFQARDMDSDGRQVSTTTAILIESSFQF